MMKRKKNYDQPRQHIKKERHYFANEVMPNFPSSQSSASSSSHVWERWTIKKAERQRIDAFELWCWRRLLRVPGTARRSNQSILKEISPEYSLEGLMLKLKLQYFGHLMRRTESLIEEEKGTPEHEMVGWHHRLDRHESEQSLGVGNGQGDLMCHSPRGRKKSWT